MNIPENMAVSFLGDLLPDPDPLVKEALRKCGFVEVPLQFDPDLGLKLRIPVHDTVVRLNVNWDAYQKSICATAFMPGASIRGFNMEFEPHQDLWARSLAAAVISPLNPIEHPADYERVSAFLLLLGRLLSRIVRKNMGSGNLPDASAS